MKARKHNKASTLTPADRKMFDGFKIPAALLQAAGVHRVTDPEARQLGIGGRARGGMQGIAFPHHDPETGAVVTVSVRRDHPEMKDGKPVAKYMKPTGQHWPYFPPDAAKMLKDQNTVIVLVEAQKSVLAGTASAKRTKRKVLFVGMGGCWGWSHNKKAIPALLQVCNGRRVIVLLDANVSTKQNVKDAQEAFVAELRKPEHGVEEVLAGVLPQIEGVNGPDDLLAQQNGDVLLTEVLDAASAPDALGAFSDDALALQFTEQYGDDLRYVDKWGTWLAFDGHRWQRDETLSVYNKAREICRAAAEVCGKKQIAQRVRSAQTVAAVERLARADRQHAATVEQWDADPWLLNTPDGVVDLRIGKLRTASREDYMSKITSIAPGGDCPLWRKFLNEVTASDKELQAYVQRMLGYILTGVTSEHALFFLYGTGANGKSVLVNVIIWILSDYARVAPMETFVASQTESHPTDLAGLQGARLVVASEAEDGKRWNESKLKSLTGGDKISARLMRQDFFDFTPQFKLTATGNHRPGLRSVDEAMRRRINLIPFNVTIPPAKRDPRLTEKLRAEGGGILQWMIEGCLAWQRVGLAPPKAVSAATDNYMAAEDALGRWLEECTVRAPNAKSGSSGLFSDWRRWAENACEFVGSQKRFSQNLEARGYAPAKGRTENYFVGLELVPWTERASRVTGETNTKKYTRDLAVIRGGK